MIEKIDIAPKYRYERKFVLTNFAKAEVLHHIKMHPAFFREIYHQRQINNVYLDTEELQFFHDNQKGIAERKKVRIRWYGKTFAVAENPVLEYKIKKGLAGDKHSFPLKQHDFQKPLQNTDIQEFINKSNLPKPISEDLKVLHPTLLNSYQRTYFQTADKKFRLTVDEDLTYYRPDRLSSHFHAKQVQKNTIIIELKYAPEDDSTAGKIAGAFPFRLDKSSKYVNGIEIWTRK